MLVADEAAREVEDFDSQFTLGTQPFRTTLLAATAEIEAGRYDVVAVVGVEQMRNVSGREAADHLGVAAWADREAVDATFLWPAMFSDIAAAYRQRHPCPRMRHSACLLQRLVPISLTTTFGRWSRGHLGGCGGRWPT